MSGSHQSGRSSKLAVQLSAFSHGFFWNPSLSVPMVLWFCPLTQVMVKRLSEAMTRVELRGYAKFWLIGCFTDDF